MADTKYGKYLTTNIFRPTRAGGIMASSRQLKSFIGGDFSFDCLFQTKPYLTITKPHKHEFDQYLCFLGASLEDISDFDAEIEFSLGEEHEKHIITEPTLVYVPAGLSHGPLEYVKVNKPVLFVDIAMTSKYRRISETGQLLEYDGEPVRGSGGE